MSFSRRDLLKAFCVTAAGGSARLVPLDAAEKAHRRVNAEKVGSSSGGYIPKFFRLCSIIYG